MKLDECNIQVEAWQMQCCGEPFKIGDYVEWFGKHNSPVKVCYGMTIPYSEDHHGQENLHIHGTIDYIWSEIGTAPSSWKAYDYAKTHNEITPIASANGWESVSDDDEGDVRRIFWGYIVRLKNVEIRPYTRHHLITKLNKKTAKQFHL